MAIRTNASCAFVCKTDDSHNVIHKRLTFASALSKEIIYQDHKIERIQHVLIQQSNCWNPYDVFLHKHLHHLILLTNNNMNKNDPFNLNLKIKMRQFS